MKANIGSYCRPTILAVYKPFLQQRAACRVYFLFILHTFAVFTPTSLYHALLLLHHHGFLPYSQKICVPQRSELRCCYTLCHLSPSSKPVGSDWSGSAWCWPCCLCFPLVYTPPPPTPPIHPLLYIMVALLCKCFCPVVWEEGVAHFAICCLPRNLLVLTGLQVHDVPFTFLIFWGE
jgi:hypothetical protein